MKKNHININYIHFYKNYQSISIKYNNKKFYFFCLNKNTLAFKKNCNEIIEFNKQSIHKNQCINQDNKNSELFNGNSQVNFYKNSHSESMENKVFYKIKELFNENLQLNCYSITKSSSPIYTLLLLL